ncbi:DeoR/GlpR family DNA-binding transcription regulator [Bacillus sp. FJAT-50079]|uniref:DeoR/GlpR family DNA-binding transcription regulator n=1 Tax=Bacillus sp. FJAT-50079 TaxID=2833577 RepID=UPI001BC982B5|nr:DeoR/GlpR family DNA-binding transcription regulator [Bacillus sp. FJAT-50079]MBS4208472.1 DeoR/GlpR transcriptional regulator [Bacillus sp. FJAT-50079]
MLTPERHAIILQILKEKGTVKIQELVERTQSSESTIRRDLTQLEEDHFLKRIHGGASLLQGKLIEPSMVEKSTKNLHQKQKIAQYAASIVEDGDCIYLDAGSTTKEMIPYLNQNDLVVVTNGLEHIAPLLEKGIRTYLIGGYAKNRTNATIGRGALVSLGQYRFDKCFLGVNGIHSELAFTTPDQEEAMVKKKATTLSNKNYVLADETKFGEISFAKIMDLNKADIITTQLDQEILSLFKGKTTIKVVSE